MKITDIPFKETGYFSSLICDYLDQKDSLQDFYNFYPTVENFKSQIEIRKKEFSSEKRAKLNEVLMEQYANYDLPDAVEQNLRLLKDKGTFTVVTGHQLNIFTGPLYFLYKIISTINLSAILKEAYPNYNFVPVYWMATEDHDFDEINYFNLHGKKFQWNRSSEGAVGRLSTKGLEEVYEALVQELGTSVRARELTDLFRRAYLEHDNLADATRFLANSLFGSYGLVVIDGDNKELKRMLSSYVEKDLNSQLSYKRVEETKSSLESLSTSYKIQVNPRPINYFYLEDGLRERILEKEGRFYINNTDLEFSKEAFLKVLKEHPERFSPNVVTRPLYQEIILPNLCYIGGGGELAYWLELKSSFEAFDVPFPSLLLRNSVLLVSAKQHKKIKNIGIGLKDLFLKQSSFINKRIREISNIEIDLSQQKEFLKEHFEAMYTLAEQTDKSFYGAVKAQEIKQLKGMDVLEKRLLKAQKRKLKDEVTRLCDLQNQLFPNKSLQERSVNFSEFYLEIGEDLIPLLKDHLNPLGMSFSVVNY